MGGGVVPLLLLSSLLRRAVLSKILSCYFSTSSSFAPTATRVLATLKKSCRHKNSNRENTAVVPIFSIQLMVKQCWTTCKMTIPVMAKLTMYLICYRLTTTRDSSVIVLKKCNNISNSIIRNSNLKFTKFCFEIGSLKIASNHRKSFIKLCERSELHLHRVDKS